MTKILTRRWVRHNISAGDADELIEVIASGAEPHMLIERNILETIFWHPDWFGPALAIDRPADGSIEYCPGLEECSDLPAGSVCFVNTLLRLNIDGHQTLWRIARYRADDCGAWEMVWPD